MPHMRFGSHNTRKTILKSDWISGLFIWPPTCFKNHLQLYPLIHNLASEARRLPRITVLLDDGKVHHHQRKSCTKIQKQLFEGFDKMISGDFSVKQLLAHVNEVYDPYVDPEPAPAGAAAEPEYMFSLMLYRLYHVNIVISY